MKTIDSLKIWKSKTASLMLFIILIVINFIWLLPSLYNIDMLVARNLHEKAIQADQMIDAYLNNAVFTVEQLSYQIILRPDDVDKLMSFFLSKNSQFSSIKLINTDGLEIIKKNKDTKKRPIVLKDESNNPGLYVALQGGVYISPNFVNADNESFLNIMVPVGTESRAENVLSANLTYEHFVEFADELFINYGMELFIVDNDGRIVAHRSQKQLRFNTALSDDNLVQKVIIDGQLISSEQKSLIASATPETNQETVLLVGRPFNQKFAIFIEQDLKYAYANKWDIYLLSALMFMFAVIFFYTLYQLINKFIEQSNALSDANRRLSGVLDEQDVGAKMLIKRDLELSDANAKLKSLDQTKSNFVSVAAHQLRTPLSAIKWGLSLLLNGDFGMLQPEQKGMILRTYESNERMITLVNDMLNVDRIESRKLKHRFIVTKLPAVINHVLLELIPVAKKREISIDFIDSKSALPHVYVDPEKMRVVIQNLIENAIKYTMNKGTVTITVRKVGQMLQTSVSDTGIGIPKEQQENIFQQFYRAENAVKIEANGSGLGLYMVKNVIEKYGGAIWFESVEKKGTTFHFTLPIYQGENVDA